MPSIISAGTTTGTALSLTSDTSGDLQIKTNNGSTTAMTLTTAGNVGIGTASPTTPLQVNGTITATSVNANNTFGFKNRIINGAMVIDQRNAGASVSIPSTATFTLDRYGTVASQSSKFSVQQNAGSVTPPVGFSNYLGVTSSSAYSVPSNEIFCFYQNIEGFNTADLQWGTANAKTITISFWVRSSLTGTFGGSVANDAFNRSYPYSYTISAANTWEFKSITIPGDTTGTWLGATNGVGIRVYFPVGVGADFSGTAGSWTGSGLISATGAVSVVGTSGATFYVTGVQLEIGSTATSFDFRAYGTELNLCRRYTQVYRSNTNGIIFPCGWYFDGNNIRFIIMFDQEMRAACAVSFFGTANTDYLVMNNATGQSGFTWGSEQLGTRSCVIQAGKTAHGLSNQPTVNLYIATSNAGGIICSAEL